MSLALEQTTPAIETVIVRQRGSVVRTQQAVEAVLVPVAGILAAVLLFSLFLLIIGKSPLAFFEVVWRGGFGTWFSLQNTLQRAAPILLTALCVAIPAQLGLVIIGGEGALVLGGLGAAAIALPLQWAPSLLVQLMMAAAGITIGAVWIGAVGWLRDRRGVNETIASLLMAYIAIALMNHIVEGPLRDPASLNKPSTAHIGEFNLLGSIPGMDVHPGLVVGLIACLGCWVLMSRTTFGFAARITGGNVRAAQIQGLPTSRLVLTACAIAGGCAGLAGMIEVAAVHGRANASLMAGYGYTGILVAFLARHNPLAIIPVAILLGGIDAAGGLVQRRMALPDATVLVLKGTLFICVLVAETLTGRIAWLQPRSVAR